MRVRRPVDASPARHPPALGLRAGAATSHCIADQLSVPSSVSAASLWIMGVSPWGAVRDRGITFLKGDTHVEASWDSRTSALAPDTL